MRKRSLIPIVAPPHLPDDIDDEDDANSVVGGDHDFRQDGSQDGPPDSGTRDQHTGSGKKEPGRTSF